MNKKERYCDWNWIFFVTSLYLINALVARTPVLSGIIGFLEFFFLIVLRVKQSLYFIPLTLIVISGIFDMGGFVYGEVGASVFNALFLPGLQGYGFIVFLLVCVFKALVFFKNNGINNSKLYLIIRICYFIPIIGILMGLISIIINDNSILNIKWTKYLYGDFIAYSVIPLLLIVFIQNIIRYREKLVFLIEKSIITILISIILLSYIGISIGVFGYYGTNKIIMAPLTLFYTPFIILFAFFPKYKIRITSIVFFLLSLFLQFQYGNALGGKSWFALIYVFIVIVILIYRKGYKKLILGSLYIIVLTSSMAIAYIDTLIKEAPDSLGLSKLNQVILVLSFTNVDWLSTMPRSPKVRVEEFLNIIDEYKEKPLYSLVGKGFGGSIKDYRNGFGFYDDSAFSLDQYQNNSFINVHEAINSIFLKFGYLGLGLLFIGFVGLFNKNYSSPWAYIGAIWLILFYGYSIVLGALGSTCLLLSYSKKFKQD